MNTMNITITYCKPCGYLKRAEQTASLLNEKLNMNSTLIPGKGGIFEVAVEGKTVSKRTRSGFPTEDEIIEAVSAEMHS